MQTCEDLGASLFVHPWDMAMGGRYSKYWLPWLVGMPAETATAICCLLMGGVLHRSRVRSPLHPGSCLCSGSPG